MKVSINKNSNSWYNWYDQRAITPS